MTAEDSHEALRNAINEREQREDKEPDTPRTLRAVAEVGLMPLVGSEMDVAKASDIRAALLIQADDVLSELRSNQILSEEEHTIQTVPVPRATHAQVQTAQAALNRLRHQTDAAWWIASQHHTAQELLDVFINSINGQ